MSDVTIDTFSPAQDDDLGHIGGAVYEVVLKLRKARFDQVCSLLPYAKVSISLALYRLKVKRKVELLRDQKGEYWSVKKRGFLRTGRPSDAV